MGEGCGSVSAGNGHDDRMEAHCGNRRREDRQGPPHLWSGSVGRDRCHVHDRPRRLVWAAREYYARSVVGRGGHHGREPFWLAMVHGTEPGDGMGADAAGLDDAVRVSVLGVPEVLSTVVTRSRWGRQFADQGLCRPRRPSSVGTACTRQHAAVTTTSPIAAVLRIMIVLQRLAATYFLYPYPWVLPRAPQLPASL